MAQSVSKALRVLLAWGERILRLVLRLFIFGLLSLVIYGIAWTLFLEDSGVILVLRWIVLPILALLWVFLAFAFGLVPTRLFETLTEPILKSKQRAAERALEEQRKLVEPDFAAAERLHGPLPADVLALYRSPRRLLSDVIFGDPDDEDLGMHVVGFLPLDAKWPNKRWPPRGPWIPIAHDGFDNYYLAHLEKAEGGRTPIYFCDHDGGGPVPFSIDLDVADLVDGPIRRFADEPIELPPG